MAKRYTNIEAERDVIAGIMVKEDFLSEIADDMTHDYFNNDDYKLVYLSALKILRSGNTPTIISISNELKASKSKVGVAQLSEIASGFTGVQSSRASSRIVVEQYQKNRLFEMMMQTAKEMEKKKPLEMADQLLMAIDEIYKTDNKRHEIDDMESVDLVLDELQQTMQTGKPISGLMTGWKEIDLATNGFQKGALVIIGARTSIGKSAFAINLNKKLNHNGAKGMYFSLEMGHRQLMIRRLAIGAGVKMNAMKYGRLTDDEMKRFNMVADKIAQENKNTVDDSSGLTVGEIRRRAKKAKQKYNIDYIIIDHMHIMKTPDGIGRTEAMTNVSMGLKAIAKDLDIVVFSLSQLNRGTEHGTEKPPQLHNLRDSGAVEQDADIVILLHRDRTLKDPVVPFTVDIAKNREGKTGEIEFEYDMERQIIDEISY